MINFVICFSVLVLVRAQDNIFALNILHYNDFHARFVETSPWGGVCNPTEAPCIGGFARLTTLVREGFEREPDSLLLNAGDSFQGTIWYNLLRWNVTQEFMNILPHDAHVLGNHEFDNGVEGVVPYLEHLNSPVVTANMEDDLEPTIQGLYEPSIIVERNGRRIGIIGIIISTTNTLASTGQLRFTDEIETARTEAEKLHEQGVDIIIVLSHAGFDIDQEIALHGGPHIDIIVGGHSHTLLFNGDPPEDSGFRPAAPYPTVVEQETRKVLIVQAAAHTQYLGEIKLFFDDGGNLLDWEGNSHFIGNEVEQAPDVLDKINFYLPIVEAEALVEVGTSMVHMSSSCACAECNLGNFLCDAFMHSVIDRAEGDNWHYAHFCVINQGGIRVDIGSGVITFESVLLSTPFENNVEVFELRGDHIIEMLEFSVANEPYPGARMLQVSGLRPVFDGSRPLGERVTNVTVRCIECDVPRYEPLQLDKYYKIVSQNFIGEGGDGFSIGLLADFLQREIHNVPTCEMMDLSTSLRHYFKYVVNYFLDEASSRYFLSPFQARGIRPVFDGSKPVGSRVMNVTVRCIECEVPRYELLNLDKYYRVVTTDFIGNGGGEYYMISDNRINVEVIGIDYNVLVDYIQHQSPIFTEVDGRVQIQNACIV